MGDVGPAKYMPALLPPCPTIRVLSHLINFCSVIIEVLCSTVESPITKATVRDPTNPFLSEISEI